MGVESGGHAVHHQRSKSLRLRDGAVLMSEQKGLEVDDLFAKLGHGGGQRIILCGEKLNLGLKVG